MPIIVQPRVTVAQVAPSRYRVNVTTGRQGPRGLPGDSAYQVAVAAGFDGTQAEWLASLVGEDGLSAYQVAVAEGFSGDESAWLASLVGEDGFSAYQVAVAEGFSGDESAWLASLVGETGDNGWAPVFALVSDGDRQVLQVSDWTGGQGTKPATGQFVGPTGLVANIANGVNLRGSSAAGPAGTGTELQFRSGAGTLGAVEGSSVNGPDVSFAGVLDAARFGARVDRLLANPAMVQLHWDTSFAVPITSGSGAQLASGWSAAVRTGTTPSSRANLYFGPATDLFFAAPNQNRIVVDFRKRLTFAFAFSALTTSANGQIFIRLSENAGTAGNLTNRGIGIRVNGNTLVAQCHNGTTLTSSATLKTITAGVDVTWIVMQSDGLGGVQVWVDDVLATTMSGGPTSLATSLVTAAIETLNNADSAETSLRVSPLKIIAQP